MIDDTISRVTKGMVEAAMLLKQINGKEEQKVNSRVNLDHVYCANFMANTIKGVCKEQFYCDILEGSGGELSSTFGSAPSFNSIISSAALAVNSFAPWKRDSQYLSYLSIRTNERVFDGFKRLEFEHKAENGIKGGHTPPNLDIWLENKNGVLAIESKFCETLSTHGVVEFSTKYNKLVEDNPVKFEGSPWVAAMLNRGNGENGIDHYRFLNAAQLIKHYFGLMSSVQGKKHLLYLYWRPTNENWDKLIPYQQHKLELGKFSELVKGDKDVQFFCMTYQELWEYWDTLGIPEVSSHVKALRDRYCITIADS